MAKSQNTAAVLKTIADDKSLELFTFMTIILQYNDINICKLVVSNFLKRIDWNITGGPVCQL